MTKNTIGRNIRSLRKQKNMQQNDLALLLNIRRQTVSSYELGKSIPDIFTLIRIADIFQVSLDELSGRAPVRKE